MDKKKRTDTLSTAAGTEVKEKRRLEESAKKGTKKRDVVELGREVIALEIEGLSELLRGIGPEAVSENRGSLPGRLQPH